MTDECKVYIDRLRLGESVEIIEELDPAFIEIDEQELRFDQPIYIKGEATLADKEIALRLVVTSSAKIVCSICNTLFEFPILLNPFIYCQPIAEVKDHVFDFQEPLREAILLEIPYVAECHPGHCPERKNISRYLATDSAPEKEKEEWHPFKDL